MMLNRVVSFLVRIYQLAISPYIGRCCRFQPTCSEYARSVLASENFFKAMYLIFKRIGKCHPLGPHGYDPPPSEKLKEKNYLSTTEL